MVSQTSVAIIFTVFERVVAKLHGRRGLSIYRVFGNDNIFQTNQILI